MDTRSLVCTPDCVSLQLCCTPVAPHTFKPHQEQLGPEVFLLPRFCLFALIFFPSLSPSSPGVLLSFGKQAGHTEIGRHFLLLLEKRYNH